MSKSTLDDAVAPVERHPWLAWWRQRPNLIRIISVTAFLLWWEYVGRGMNPLFMSYPTAIFKAGWAMTASGELPAALVASMVPFSIGLVLSIVGGIALGILLGQFWLLEYMLDPFLNALYVIPRVALIPLIVLWAGLELTGKVVIVTLVAIFPVIVNTYSGIKDVRGSLMEIGKAYGATEFQNFTKIILPAQNRRDMDEVPKELFKDIRFVFVDNMRQVFREALKEKTAPALAATSRPTRLPQAASGRTI